MTEGASLKILQTEIATRFEAWKSDGEWREQAKCRGSDLERYFPEGLQYCHKDVKDIAARDCAPCPVRKECLRDALATRGTVGIFGGILFPGALVRFDADGFERALVWDTYAPNLEATRRIEQRRKILG